MDLRYSKTSLHEVVPSTSICSCPSCDSVKCFSRRHYRGLKKPIYNNCDSTDCHFVSDAQTSTYNDNVDLSHDQDIVKIDEFVINGHGYGEITEVIFADHKKMLVTKMMSTNAQTMSNAFDSDSPLVDKKENAKIKEHTYTTTSYPVQQPKYPCDANGKKKTTNLRNNLPPCSLCQDERKPKKDHNHNNKDSLLTKSEKDDNVILNQAQIKTAEKETELKKSETFARCTTVVNQIKNTTNSPTKLYQAVQENDEAVNVPYTTWRTSNIKEFEEQSSSICSICQGTNLGIKHTSVSEVGNKKNIAHSLSSTMCESVQNKDMSIFPAKSCTCDREKCNDAKISCSIFRNPQDADRSSRLKMTKECEKQYLCSLFKKVASKYCKSCKAVEGEKKDINETSTGRQNKKAKDNVPCSTCGAGSILIHDANRKNVRKFPIKLYAIIQEQSECGKEDSFSSLFKPTDEQKRTKIESSVQKRESEGLSVNTGTNDEKVTLLKLQKIYKKEKEGKVNDPTICEEIDEENHCCHCQSRQNRTFKEPLSCTTCTDAVQNTNASVQLKNNDVKDDLTTLVYEVGEKQTKEEENAQKQLVHNFSNTPCITIENNKDKKIPPFQAYNILLRGKDTAELTTCQPNIEVEKKQNTLSSISSPIGKDISGQINDIDYNHNITITGLNGESIEQYNDNNDLSFIKTQANGVQKKDFNILMAQDKDKKDIPDENNFTNKVSLCTICNRADDLLFGQQHDNKDAKYEFEYSISDTAEAKERLAIISTIQQNNDKVKTIRDDKNLALCIKTKNEIRELSNDSSDGKQNTNFKPLSCNSCGADIVNQIMKYPSTKLNTVLEQNENAKSHENCPTCRATREKEMSRNVSSIKDDYSETASVAIENAKTLEENKNIKSLPSRTSGRAIIDETKYSLENSIGKLHTHLKVPQICSSCGVALNDIKQSLTKIAGKQNENVPYYAKCDATGKNNRYSNVNPLFCGETVTLNKISEHSAEKHHKVPEANEDDKSCSYCSINQASREKDNCKQVCPVLQQSEENHPKISNVILNKIEKVKTTTEMPELGDSNNKPKHTNGNLPTKQRKDPLFCSSCGSALSNTKESLGKRHHIDRKQNEDLSYCPTSEASRLNEKLIDVSSQLLQNIENAPNNINALKKKCKLLQENKYFTDVILCSKCKGIEEIKLNTSDFLARRQNENSEELLQYNLCGAALLNDKAHNLCRKQTEIIKGDATEDTSTSTAILENIKDAKAALSKVFEMVLSERKDSINKPFSGISENVDTNCSLTELQSENATTPSFCTECGARFLPISDNRDHLTTNNIVLCEEIKIPTHHTSSQTCTEKSKKRSSTQSEPNVDDDIQSSIKTSPIDIKFKAAHEEKRDANQRLQKPLTKKDIYNRILEAYKNCNCAVCECIVTMNDMYPPTSQSCNYEHIESITNSAKSSHKTPGSQQALMGSNNFCSCKTCDCIVCSHQAEKVCNCTMCECLQCLSRSNKKETNNIEPVATHEISTGPDLNRQQCNCALCSYHFCGHQIPDLENESCECEAQNKFMRKPNANCCHEYDIRTVSLDVWNKANPIKASVVPTCLKFPFDPNDNERASTRNASRQHNSSSIFFESNEVLHLDEIVSVVFQNTDDSYSDQNQDIFNQSQEHQTRIDIEYVENELKSEQNSNVSQMFKSTNVTACEYNSSSESLGIQNAFTSTSNSKIFNDASVLSTEPHKESGLRVMSTNIQIYNISQYTFKHNNSSKLTTSSRNISMGSSKLLQTIIHEICHEILETIIMEATKDGVVNTESFLGPKSITVLKDAKTKCGQVDFSESSLQMVPTTNKTPDYVTQPEFIESVDYTEHDDSLLINDDLFNRRKAKKPPKDKYQECNFCIVDENFGNIRNCNGHNEREKNLVKNESQIIQDFQQTTVPSHAMKISRPDFPLKYSWKINNTYLDDGSQISIHDGNNFEYYNNIFELQVYNIRLENTLKKAKTFSMELMKMLHKFEKANKNFKSLSKKFRNNPSDLEIDGDEEESTFKTEQRIKLSTVDHPSRRSSPIRKFKTCFKLKSSNKEPRNENDIIPQETHNDRGQSSHEIYSECILYKESLDKAVSSPYAMKSRHLKSDITEHNLDTKNLNERMENDITIEGSQHFKAFQESTRHSSDDDFKSYEANYYKEDQQDTLSRRKWSNMRKNFYLTDAKPPMKSIGVLVRPISMLNKIIHEDVKSVVVQTNLWDSNMCKKKTYENRALAKLKMEVTQLSNMPFLQPNVWSKSYEDGGSDSKSDSGDFSNVTLKPRATLKDNMWDTLLEDIDYCYTLPPKPNTADLQFDYNLDRRNDEYQKEFQGLPKMEGHTFIHHQVEPNLKLRLPRDEYIDISPSRASLASKGLIDQETSYKSVELSQFSIFSHKEPPLRFMKQSKRIDIPYSPQGKLSEHGHPIDYTTTQTTVASPKEVVFKEYGQPIAYTTAQTTMTTPKEEIFKDIKRYKDFLKDLQLKGRKTPPQEKNTLDCKHSSCSCLKVAMVAVRRVSNHTAVVKWTAPQNVNSVLGYEVLIDGRGVQKILNPWCRMCVVTCLPYTDAVLVTIRTLTSRVAGHAPAATVVYRPRAK